MEDKSLNKFISESGYCSRRQADKLIELGRVTLNGKVAQKGNRATVKDDVRIDGNPLPTVPSLIYIALNKPSGVICTTDRNVKQNIIDFVRHPQRIFPIGRLDRASEGLILLTNDGEIVNKILRGANGHEKEYIVTVDKPLTKEFLEKMASGVPILSTITRPCEVWKEGPTKFRIILTQGLNRQIRRMCEFLGFEVTRLIRQRIMNIELGGLPHGRWRELTKEEFAQMSALLVNSSKLTLEQKSKKIEDDGN
jgi:23S rRNA pseudouridine2604 synthase